MPGMFNVMAHWFPDLCDHERLYAVNPEAVICTNVFGPRLCFPDNAEDGEMLYSIRIVMHDIALYAGKFRTMEEAEETHKELINIIDLALQERSL